MKVVVLAGGKGTRLGLADRPKPMVPIAGKPLLERLVEVGIASGFDEFVFLNGHMAHVIEDHFGDGSRFGARITHVREPAPLGTAGSVHYARELLTEPFIVLYGDILIDVDLAHFVRFHREHGGLATLFVHPNDHPHDSDLVSVGKDARITAFHPKPHTPGQLLPNLVSAALYVIEPEAIDFVPDGTASDWAKDVFPRILAAGRPLHAYRSIEYAKDMGTPDRLAKGEADLSSGRVRQLSRRSPKPAIFVDRDGVLNREIDGVHRPEDLVLLGGVGPAVKAVNRAGIPLICITNQPDVAKGFMTFDTLETVLAALDTQLARDGAYLDELYYCPHHPEKGWEGEIPELKVECDCRKPKPGMLRNAADDHNIDLPGSWMIGDRFADLAAAREVGALTALVRTGHAGADRNRFGFEADLEADDFAAAVDRILGILA